MDDEHWDEALANDDDRPSDEGFDLDDEYYGSLDDD